MRSRKLSFGKSDFERLNFSPCCRAERSDSEPRPKALKILRFNLDQPIITATKERPIPFWGYTGCQDFSDFKHVRSDFRDFKDYKYFKNSKGLRPTSGGFRWSFRDFSDFKSGFMHFRPDFRGHRSADFKDFKPGSREFHGGFQGYQEALQEIYVRFQWFQAGFQRFQGFQDGFQGKNVGFLDICTPDYRSSWHLVLQALHHRFLPGRIDCRCEEKAAPWRQFNSSAPRERRTWH